MESSAAEIYLLTSIMQLHGLKPGRMQSRLASKASAFVLPT